ncbi:hypothetical protein FOMPIDRAFT_1017114 [Fomitopsis schrenkii]|uniref:Uncharacterized protein n=1 Tax=Fomitopsis schrenkii TaxID=2126942 RepID=S8E2L4_FOMSC|nr:hypothetical protein FOMPIDRAFT_1017114 [Fomitopsis schrenkii]
MPLIRPSGGIDSETSTLVNYGMSEDTLDSYVLEPLPERDSEDDGYLEEENTAWSARSSKKQKVKSHSALPASARAGRDTQLTIQTLQFLSGVLYEPRTRSSATGNRASLRR